MFEKEAEEYIKANNLEWELECHRTSPIGEVKQAFQNGAEFGYNKAKEEMQAQIEKMKCCGNCSKNGHICVAEEMQGKLCGKNKDKWELRR